MKWRELKDGEAKKQWLVVGAFFGMIAYLALTSVGAGGWIICPFHALTGLSCPGCGMTRSATAAISGDWAISFKHHPFGLAFVTAFAGAAAAGLIFGVLGKRVEFGPRLSRLRDGALWIVLIALLMFGVVRLVGELGGILTPG